VGATPPVYSRNPRPQTCGWSHRNCGDRLAKTIVFAKNQAHAQFVEERLNANYPEHGGQFARVITHSVTCAHARRDLHRHPGGWDRRRPARGAGPGTA
jgi:hypothetical protein